MQPCASKTDFKVYPHKIDIYGMNKQRQWVYLCTSNASKTCKEAVQRFLTIKGMREYLQLKANFQKTASQTRIKLTGKIGGEV